jgi:heme/copper-type cytochrome/quinol oxidase subunit 4
MARRKQIQFQGKQGHDKTIEMAVVIFVIVCIVFTIIAIYTVGGGSPP